MTQKERAIIAFALTWAVFFLNLVGGYFSWYSGLWWYDMIMHFTGGLMIGTIAILFSFTKTFPWFGTIDQPNYKKIIGAIFLAILFWEGLEFGLFSIGGDTFYIIDAMSDVALGISGALFILSRATIIEKNRV